MLYQKKPMEQMPNSRIMDDYNMIWNEPQVEVEEEIYIEDEE